MNQKGSTGILVIVFLVLLTSVGALLFWQTSSAPVMDDILSRESDATLSGTWQSLDDAQSVVEYSDDGTMRDVYGGVEMSSGTWRLSGDDATDLRAIIDGEEYRYAILELTDTRLIMSYMPRGNTLRYERVDAEQVFNMSGRAKAIEQESDLWREYSDDRAGFSLKYPGNVEPIWSSAGTQYSLRMMVDVQDTSTFEEFAPLGMDTDTVSKNLVALSNGEYGEGVDVPFNASKRVREVSGIYAQDFMVLARFEVCSVLMERKLYFLHNGQQVIITLYGPQEAILQESPEYFTQDTENCGEEMIWNFNKQEDFYNNLKNGTGARKAQEWYDTFDAIVETLEIDDEE